MLVLSLDTKLEINNLLIPTYTHNTQSQQDQAIVKEWNTQLMFADHYNLVLFIR